MFPHEGGQKNQVRDKKVSGVAKGRRLQGRG
jgi:hypothetical protein